MDDFPVNFREVIVNDTSIPNWNEITINTGASQSPLQDIKLPDSSGGLVYDDQLEPITRNRYIYWRASYDTLELIEESLDLQLIGSNLRIRFQESPILDGITAHETSNNIILLVPTVSSVHRLYFPHPTRTSGSSVVGSVKSDFSFPSIFFNVTSASLKTPNSYYIISSSQIGNPLPRLAASWFHKNEEAYFGLGFPNGSLLLVQLGPMMGTVTELRQDSIMQRIWTGLVPTAFRSTELAGNSLLGLLLHPVNQELVLFGLSRDSELKMWSCVRKEALASESIMSPSETKLNLQIGTQQHMMRLVRGTDQVQIAVFLCFVDSASIKILQPDLHHGRYRFQKMTDVHLFKCHVLNFSITASHLWVLCLMKETELMLKYTTLDGTMGIHWGQVHLEKSLSPKLEYNEGMMDPKQAALEAIFYPGRFSAQTLSKSVQLINKFRHPHDSRYLGSYSGWECLKDMVCSAVENDIKRSVADSEITDREYLEISSTIWSKFYASCVHYNMLEMHPLGLIVEPKIGLYCIIRKSLVTYLRSMEGVEHLVLDQPKNYNIEQLANTPIFCEDRGLCDDVVKLVMNLNLVSSWLSEEDEKQFDESMKQMTSPGVAATELLSTISPDQRTELFKSLNNISSLPEALNMLVRTLEVDAIPIQIVEPEPENSARRMALCRSLFSSKTGASLLSQCVGQVTQMRFIVSRNLLLYLMLTNSCHSVQLRADLKSYTSQIIVLCQIFFVLKSLSEMQASVPCDRKAEAEGFNTSSLDISGSATQHAKGSNMSFFILRSVLDLFVESEGGMMSRETLASTPLLDIQPLISWVTLVPFLTQFVLQLMWPHPLPGINEEYLFSEALLQLRQYLQLQEYVRLIKPWCEYNISANDFMLGQAMLMMSEPAKACDLFVNSYCGVLNSPLVNRILHSSPVDSNRMKTFYFLKVIRLFEEAKYPDFIKDLAQYALKESFPDDPAIPTIWSILFKYEFELGDYYGAFEAVQMNPDVSSQRDCLKRLLVALCENNRLDVILNLDYLVLEEEALRILVSRARNADLNDANYYNLLYSFYIKKSNYKKAGSIMYECAYRIGIEMTGLDSLQMQHNYYLASLNCLNILDPSSAWIAKPLTASEEGVQGDGSRPPVREIEVLELVDIYKEYHLIKARLLLAEFEPETANISGFGFSASEITAQLLNAGLFDVAHQLCNTFELPCACIVEALVSKCLHATQRSLSSQDVENIWGWLGANDLSALPNQTSPVVDLMWSFLREYLARCERPRQTICHRVVANRILRAGMQIPHWLYSSYNKRNFSELLRLYLQHGMLQDATQLTLLYIDGVLGQKSEDFNLPAALHVTSPPVWIPYSAIDHLYYEVQNRMDEAPYDQLYEDLTSTMTRYCDVAQRVSNDMLKLKWTAQSS